LSTGPGLVSCCRPVCSPRPSFSSSSLSMPNQKNPNTMLKGPVKEPPTDKAVAEAMAEVAEATEAAVAATVVVEWVMPVAAMAPSYLRKAQQASLPEALQDCISAAANP